MDRQPKPGERWRLTFEGRVTGTSAYSNAARIEGMPDYVSLDHGTWERLPDPEPEWAPGDLVLDADGRLCEFEPHPERYVHPGWRIVRTGGYVTDDLLPRPLRRLVVEEK